MEIRIGAMPENREYQPIVLSNKNKWEIFGKVLLWMGKGP